MIYIGSEDWKRESQGLGGGIGGARSYIVEVIGIPNLSSY